MTGDERLGTATTLRAALAAGWIAGLPLGLLDGIAAGVQSSTQGALAWLGCLSASVVVYCTVWTVVALALGLLLHRALRTRTFEQRWRTLLALVLGLGVFLDLYWWTRPWFFYGVPASDPRRIALAVVQLGVGLALGWTLARGFAAAFGSAKRAVAVAIALVWLVGGVYLWHQSARISELGRINERNRDLPNVLLFVCDAMRADVLGCYGNQRVKTPRIDALAADGVVFTNALVQAPFTGSSFGSYFTGKYPRRHGFVKMTADARMAQNITLASHLKSADLLAGGKLQPDDYHCITFMTGALSNASGLARGFDSYYEAFAGHDLVHVEDAWSVFRSELVLVILATKLEQRLGDGAVATQATQWLHEHGRERFFAMVHLFATHTPYDPPSDLSALYCDPNYHGPLTAFRSDHREAIEQKRATPTEADIAQIRNLYYAGVTHNDRMIAEVLAELEKQGALDDTIVIVTADHGEELDDHGLWEHNHMFQTNLRVPLVVRWPKKLPRGKRVDAVVESVDLVPSLCELIGLKPPFEQRLDEQQRNYGALDGVSWVPLMHADKQALKEFSFAENGLEMSIQDAEWKLIVPAVDLEGAVLDRLEARFVLQDGQWRLTTSAPVDSAPQESLVIKPRLFHLRDDPDERHDVFATERAHADPLFAVLKSWDKSMPIPRSDIVQSQRDIEQAQQRLRELGYVDGVGRGAPPPQKPK